MPSPASFNLRNSWEVAIAPPWMTEGYAQKFHYTLYLVLDEFLENATQGALARCPGFGTSTALPLLGNDRVIFRGSSETDDQYIQRLQIFWDSWRLAGSSAGLQKQFAGIIVPAQPRTRTVSSLLPHDSVTGNQSTWSTMDIGSTTASYPLYQTHVPANWDWDGNDTLPWRMWFILYSDPSTGFIKPGRAIGTGVIGGGVIGCDSTPDFVQALRQLVFTWKSKQAWDLFTIVSFDAALFDPTKPFGDPSLPDGTWGNDGKLTGGVYAPARSGNARYFAGVPYQTMPVNPLSSPGHPIRADVNTNNVQTNGV